MPVFSSVVLIILASQYIATPNLFKDTTVFEKNKMMYIIGILVGILGLIPSILYVPKIRLRFGLSKKIALIALSLLTGITVALSSYLYSLLFSQITENLVNKVAYGIALVLALLGDGLLMRHLNSNEFN